MGFIYLVFLYYTLKTMHVMIYQRVFVNIVVQYFCTWSTLLCIDMYIGMANATERLVLCILIGLHVRYKK